MEDVLPHLHKFPERAPLGDLLGLVVHDVSQEAVALAVKDANACHV